MSDRAFVKNVTDKPQRIMWDHRWYPDLDPKTHKDRFLGPGEEFGPLPLEIADHWVKNYPSLPDVLTGEMMPRVELRLMTEDEIVNATVALPEAVTVGDRKYSMQELVKLAEADAAAKTGGKQLATAGKG